MSKMVHLTCLAHVLHRVVKVLRILQLHFRNVKLNIKLKSFFLRKPWGVNLVSCVSLHPQSENTR